MMRQGRHAFSRGHHVLRGALFPSIVSSERSLVKEHRCTIWSVRLHLAQHTAIRASQSQALSCYQ